MVNGLFITTLGFFTGAIVTVYNHAIGPYNLFRKCNLFHHSLYETRHHKIGHMSGFKKIEIEANSYACI